MSETKKHVHPFIWGAFVLIFILLLIKTPVKKVSIVNRMDTGKVVLGNSIEWELLKLHSPFFDLLWKNQRQKESYEDIVLQISPLYQYLLCQEAYFSDELVGMEDIESREELHSTEDSQPKESLHSVEDNCSGEESHLIEDSCLVNDDQLQDEAELQKEIQLAEENQLQEEIQLARDVPFSFEKKFSYNWEEYQDLEKLKKDFFTVDATTDIPLEKLRPEKFLEKDLSIEKGGELPRILIYHTHSLEAFADSMPGDEAGTVVGLGARLAELLRERGFNVLHHKGKYDECRDYAYSKALPAVESILENNPSIEVIIDIHRDAVAGKQKLISTQDGKEVAKIMFFNGLSYTKKQGKISYLENPYTEENMAFAFQMHTLCNEYFPNSTRKIYLKGYRYNMHLRPKSMLVEVGAQTNSCEEAYRAMDILAHSLDLCLSPKNED